MGKHLRFVAGVLLICVLITGTWSLYWAIGPTTPQERNDFTKTMLQIFGGLVVITGLYFTWQTLLVNQKNQQINSAMQLENGKANREREKISNESLITTLYTQAVGQLGNDKREVRIGGIYALERIARESPKDYQQIIEVLAAYIRENSPWRPNQLTQLSFGTGEINEGIRPKEDIQAAINILRRRGHCFLNGETLGIDLRRTDLRGANLGEIHLEGAILQTANLTKAHLENAHLENAHLQGAYLENAYLQGAYLTRAHLECAHLEGTHLENAHLEGAYLEGTHLSGADLSGAHLTRAHLTRAHLEGAHLEGVNLEEAHLEGANLRQATMPDKLHSVRGLTWGQISVANIRGEEGFIWQHGRGNVEALKQLLPNDVVVPDVPEQGDDS